MQKGNGRRGVALVLVLFVLAATVTGVAASATSTVLPKPLTGRWRGGGDVVLMTVLPGGQVSVFDFVARLSPVAAHRLTISGVPLCAGKTGTYHWKVAHGRLRLRRIHDACKQEVTLFAGTWSRA